MIALPVAGFLTTTNAALAETLAFQAVQSHRTNERQQLRAWEVSLTILRTALAEWPAATDWQLILEYPMRRLGRRIDAVLVTPRAVLVLEFKVGQAEFLLQDRLQVEDYALDLQDFHAGSRRHPIVPILVATQARAAVPAWPLLLTGASTVLDAGAEELGDLLRGLWRRLPEPATTLDVATWAGAPYRPVPGIVDAACTLFSHHGVDDIAATRADAKNLSVTTDAILAAIAEARLGSRHLILFVTGIPGAGKTLCGLNAVFGAGRNAGATFLTGNPTLVHVLREALARDAAAGDRSQLRAARQRTKAAIQALPAFRDHHVRTNDIPAEHVTVIDEAQRAWSRDHAMRKSVDREVRLSDSEPAHLLDIMRAHKDWAVIVCLIGHGQEIHDGEGGLAEWGVALADRPVWQVRAPPALLVAADPRQRLPQHLKLREDAAMFLDVPMRSLRNPHASAWVDLVLAGDWEGARDLAARHAPMPFRLTRDLEEMRTQLRHASRGQRRCGLLASSGARRLRADGLGAELPHMDAGAVAHWFLDRWPDVRASDALETLATEFSCQGLELDFVGLCWAGDLSRRPNQARWLVRDFKGTRWQTPTGAEAIANRMNTYRVLLTRARYETLIWVPRGDESDPTRPPSGFDAIADYLASCGIDDLNADASAPDFDAPAPSVAQPVLL
jgi:hypothetical protein